MATVAPGASCLAEAVWVYPCHRISAISTGDVIERRSAPDIFGDVIEVLSAVKGKSPSISDRAQKI
jgi:hypothetical protein